MYLHRPANRWIRRLHGFPPGKVGLLCFPHVGGSAYYYKPLAAALAPEVDVLAVQYPGRLDRYAEQPVASIGRLADRAVHALELGDGYRIALFGHSMGAVIAFEVARRLERSGGTVPARIFVSGRCAPAFASPRPAGRSDDSLLAEISRLGGTDPRLTAGADYLQLIMPAIRADFRAIDTYRYAPGPPLKCPITALVGDSDPITPVSAAQQWAGHTATGFSLHVFPGGHFYLNRCLDDVAALVSRCLADGAEECRIRH